MLFESIRIAKGVRKTLGWTGGGVHKRIDEYRELLELLQREVPEFLGKHSEVIGWLMANDDFFMELEQTAAIEEGQFLNLARRSESGFPRAMPKVRDVDRHAPAQPA